MGSTYHAWGEAGPGHHPYFFFFFSWVLIIMFVLLVICRHGVQPIRFHHSLGQSHAMSGCYGRWRCPSPPLVFAMLRVIRSAHTRIKVPEIKTVCCWKQPMGIPDRLWRYDGRIWLSWVKDTSGFRHIDRPSISHGVIVLQLPSASLFGMLK